MEKNNKISMDRDEVDAVYGNENYYIHNSTDYIECLNEKDNVKVSMEETDTKFTCDQYMDFFDEDSTEDSRNLVSRLREMATVN